MIVANVLKCRPEITAKRKEIIKIPSIIRAEFSREFERLDEFKTSIRANIKEENSKQKEKFKEMKEKYDKEGIQVVESEGQIGSQVVADPNKKPLSAGQSLENLRDVNEITASSQIPGTNMSATRGRKSMKPGGGGFLKTDEDVNRYKND